MRARLPQPELLGVGAGRVEAAAEVARELFGRGVALRPGSRIRYLLVDGGGKKRATGAARGGGRGGV